MVEERSLDRFVLSLELIKQFPLASDHKRFRRRKVGRSSLEIVERKEKPKDVRPLGEINFKSEKLGGPPHFLRSCQKQTAGGL